MLPQDWYSLKEGEQIEDKGMQLTNSWNHFIAFTVKSNIFEQEQMEEEQNVEDRNISCKVLLGEGNEVCCCLCVCVCTRMRACVCS